MAFVHFSALRFVYTGNKTFGNVADHFISPWFMLAGIAMQRGIWRLIYIGENCTRKCLQNRVVIVSPFILTLAIRMISILVVHPKVAKASKEGDIAYKSRQCKQTISGKYLQFFHLDKVFQLRICSILKSPSYAKSPIETDLVYTPLGAHCYEHS